VAELVWNGKYRDGKRVGPTRVALPFQTVETVNDSAQDGTRTPDLFGSGNPTAWRNRLIRGDEKYVLPSLLPEFAGKVSLIYIDPPFATGADFSLSTEQKAYRDTWGVSDAERKRGVTSVDKYLSWFDGALVHLNELLAPGGTLYVQVDHRLVAHVRLACDELFGSDSFLNLVTWRRQIPRGMKAHARFMPFSSDYILVYAKSGAEPVWNETKKENLLTVAEAEKKYMRDERGFFRTSDPGTYSDESLIRLHKEGRIHVTKGGKFVVGNDGTVSTTNGTIGVKYYRAMRGNMVIEETVIDNIWDDIPGMGIVSSEYVGYPTQKPEALLDRIVKASSNEGDLVLDCLCGSGTTAAAAERLARRWIVADLGRFAIHTTRKRLLAIKGVKPFIVQNLGKYERQAWMAAEFSSPEDRAATEPAYRAFILDLYKAQPLAGNRWLHGVKSGRMVHVGAVDSPVTLADVKAISRELRRAAGAQENVAAADILGWEFALELNETVKHIAAEARVDVKFRRIPREVLEKAAVDQGDIQPREFFELRALSTNPVKCARTERGGTVTVELTDFVLPANDLPGDVLRTVKHWSEWIDYWAVDWTFDETTHFDNQWQSFRTRDNGHLQMKVISPPYQKPGKYTIAVEVIDTLGIDTMKCLEVEVG
jgi:adenine-specific DNA-methyltransferase